MSNDRDGFVSIVVPTRNSASKLTDCLDSISRFTGVPHEVLVVDCYSTDRTVQIAQEKGARVIGGGEERSNARNLGAEAALGSFLLFLDSDMQLGSDVVAACLRTVISERADAITIPEISIGNRFWSRVRRVERVGYRDGSPHSSPAFFRRDVFSRIGGFDVGLVSGEDYDLDLRLRQAGFRIAEVDQAINHDESEMSFPIYMRKSFFYGRSMKSFIRKHPRGVLTRFNPIRPTALSSGLKTRSPNVKSGEKLDIYVTLVPILKIFQTVFFLLGILADSVDWSKVRRTRTSVSLKGTS